MLRASAPAAPLSWPLQWALSGGACYYKAYGFGPDRQNNRKQLFDGNLRVRALRKEAKRGNEVEAMRPPVHFVETLLQEHADAVNSDHETCLKEVDLGVRFTPFYRSCTEPRGLQMFAPRIP
jgi:hypothetical protein